MRDRVLAALLTLAVFAVGFGAGTWAERHRPFPAPPATFMSEFGSKPSPPAPAPNPPVNRAQLLEQIEKIRPEIDSFRERTDEIYAQFDRDMLTVLTPEQDAVYLKKFRPQHAPPQPQDEAKPLSDEEIERLLQRPFRTLAYFVVLPMTLDRMVMELKLDDAQRDKVKDFLRVRREKFIELVDSVSPPSMMLSRLAPVAQRLSQPPKP
jgi:hypothetical protein